MKGVKTVAEEKLVLYHTGYDVIKRPDLSIGRRNADLGPGFYTSVERDFAVRWARVRKGMKTFVNTYELSTEGLLLKSFDRDMDWFRYISGNRHGLKDSFSEYDVIIGPIANDTIYETWGIITSGLMEDDAALKLLQAGPCYRQSVIKTDKALNGLKWLCAKELDHEEISGNRETVAAEEAAYQAEISRILEALEP